MGIHIALDDFGTGYSSLAYLKRFPIDVVKINRAFVKDLPFDEGSAAITTAIIAMAHALRKKVVAEGVETAAQLVFLRRLECDYIQGYYFSVPLMPDDLAGAGRANRQATGNRSHFDLDLGRLPVGSGNTLRLRAHALRFLLARYLSAQSW